jgi:hypothetical protein
MGMSVLDLRMLSKLRQAGFIPECGRVVELGAQQLANDILISDELLDRIRDDFGITTSIRWPRPAPWRHGEAPGNGPLAREFWEWLGFTYAAIDVDNTPGNIILDLNFDDVPEHLAGSFDVVTNFGTTEHVANQLNAFKVVHDLTRVGGIMLHHMPAQGYANHGFFNYNPKFFWMLCRSNGYKLLHMEYWGDVENRLSLPDDVLSFLKEFDSDKEDRAKKIGIADTSILFVMRRDFSHAFVPPLDIPTASAPASEQMRTRYWTVFDKNAF